MDWKYLFFATDGRIGQKDFWIGLLILVGANLLAGLIPLIGWIAGLVLIWCGIALTAKRLHDFGKSGWLQVIPMAVCMVIWTIGVMMTGVGLFMSSLWGADPALAVAGFASLFGLFGVTGLIGLAFLLWVGLSKGDTGPNQYGPPPLVSQFGPPPADAPPPPPPPA